MTTRPLSREQEDLLIQMGARFGPDALPQGDIPDAYWEKARSSLNGGQPSEPSALDRALGIAGRAADTIAAGLRQSWDTAIRPTFERAEEVGQVVGSPIVESLRQGGVQGAAAALPRAARDYSRGIRPYLENLKGDDGGLDFRGATEAFTDANRYSPGTVGAAGILFDPLNLLPFGKAGRAPALADDLLGALRAGDLAGGARRVGQAARGYPGAMAQEAQDLARLAEGGGRLAKEIGKASVRGALLPGMLLAGGLPMGAIGEGIGAIPPSPVIPGRGRRIVPPEDVGTEDVERLLKVANDIADNPSVPDAARKEWRDYRAQLAARRIEMTEGVLATTAPPMPRVSKGSTYSFTPGEPQMDYEITIMDLDDPDLLTSHRLEGTSATPIKDFPQDFQPRERESQAMVNNLLSMRGQFDPRALVQEHHHRSEGVPIVGDEGDQLIAESGNGRLMLLRANGGELYPAYRQALDQMAPNYGISPNELAQFERPIIVRRRTTPLTREQRIEFARGANTSALAQMNPAELARVDSERLTPRLINSLTDIIDESEDLAVPEIIQRMHRRGSFVDFLEQLPPGERTGLTVEGGMTYQGIERMQNAIVTRIFGPEAGMTVVNDFFRSTEGGMRNIQTGVARNFGRLLKMRVAVENGALDPQYNISDSLVRAMKALQQLRDDTNLSGPLAGRVNDYIQSAGGFRVPGMSLMQESKDILLLMAMAKTVRSAKPLANSLSQYLDEVARFAPTEADAGMVNVQGGLGGIIDSVPMSSGDSVMANAVVENADLTEEETTRALLIRQEADAAQALANRPTATDYRAELEAQSPNVPTPAPPEIEQLGDVQAAMGASSDEASRALNDPMPVDPEPVEVFTPSVDTEVYRYFKERILEREGDFLIMARDTMRSMPPEDLDAFMSGARAVDGEQEAQRLQDIMDGQPVNDAPPPATPPAPGDIGSGRGTGNVADAWTQLGAGGGRGSPPRRPTEIASGGPERFGFSPVHREIQVGGYRFDSLPEVNDALAKLRYEGRWQTLADKLSQKAWGRAVVRVVNASGTLAHAPIEAQGRIAVEVLRERMNRAISPMFAQLDRLGTEDAMFGRKLMEGQGDVKDVGKVVARLEDGGERLVYVAEIAENPSRYQLTPQQQEWLRVARAIDEAPRKIAEAHGQRVGEYKAKTTEHFVGRVMVGKFNESGELIESGGAIVDKRGLTGRAAITKERTFDSIEDAMKEGFVPEYSLSKTMMIRTRGAGREAVNIRVGNWLAQHFRQASRGRVPGLSVEAGTPQRQFGQGDVEVLVNTEQEGVQRRIYRLNGSEAKKIQEFVNDITLERELSLADRTLRVASRVGAEQRFAVLSADLSVIGIQLLQAWSARPIKSFKPSAKAAFEGFQAIYKPEEIAKVRADRIAQFAADGGFRRHPRLILDYGGLSEFTEAREGLISRIPVVGATIRRFGDSFDMTRDLAAISFAEISDEAAKRMEPGPLKQAKIDAIDEMTNKMLGRLRSSELGQSAGQQRLESGFLFLAPQYLRATMGMVALAMESGVRGTEARKMLLKSIGTVSLLVGAANIVSAKARGLNDRQAFDEAVRSLNPTAGEFGSVQLTLPGIGSFRAGMAGQLKALLSFLTEMVVQPEFFTGDRRRNVFSPGDRITGVRRFWEARQAPTLGLLTDLVTKEDFLGQNTDITTARGAVRVFTSNLMPIFLQNAIDEFDVSNTWQSLIRGAISLPGINTRDLRKEDLREDAMRSILPNSSYVDQEPYMKQYATALVGPELLALDQKRADNQSSPYLSGPDLNLIGQELLDGREQALLAAALDPNMEPFNLYSLWKGEDAFFAGGKKATSEGFDEIYGNLPAQLGESEAEQAFNIYRQIFEEPDQQTQQQLLDAFDAAYPPGSEVGQYIVRNRNRRRVPLAMVQRLSNYQKAQGVIESAYARYQHIYEQVSAQEGPQVAQEKADQYWRYFFMMDELEAAQAEKEAA